MDYKNQLFCYRDIGKKEIGLIFVKEQKIYLIEIKIGINPEKPTKNLDVLKKYGLTIEMELVIDCTDMIAPSTKRPI